VYKRQVSDRATSARIDDLARQIAALQSAVNVLAMRVGALEANIVDSETPLAKRPW
jgi:cell division protein FtsB